MKKSLPLPGIEPRFLGQAISLDPVSEVRLVCRAILNALYLLALNRFIRTSNPAVELAQVYARSVNPKPLTPMYVVATTQQCDRHTGMWPIQRNPRLCTSKLFRHCTAEATVFARKRVPCFRVSSDLERKFSELESGKQWNKIA